MELKPLFKDIADAIREKDGAADDIRAADFPERIRAIQGGDGSGVTVEKLKITTPPDKVSYKPGDVFTPVGMTVWAELSNGYGVYVNHSDLTFSQMGPLELGVDGVTVSFRWGEQSIFTRQEIEVTATSIYGVEWDWDNGNSTKGTRTDAAADFPEPSPAVSNGTGSSPFDDLMPWAGMVKETRAGGMEVREPKYWFKWTKTGKKLKLQIADGPVEGFHADPVNMDRGDGLGELDCSYIGRYHCAEGWKSETNKAQQVSINRNTARTGIHGLGADFWQMDFAQMWYIGMLFLVEFADWDGGRIGLGCSAKGAKMNNGMTDAMPYHTGTTAASRSTYGFTQYRNIEGWWDNVYDWMDGCYYNSKGLNVIKNPSQFSDNANGVLVGAPGGSGYPSDLAVPTQSGLEWALYPGAVGGSATTYVPDHWNFDGNKPCLFHGGSYGQGPYYGPFCVSPESASAANAYTGCRLQERPPKEGLPVRRA